MNIELTSTSVRQMADRVVTAYPEFNKPFVLEMLTKAFGHRNFDTLSGLLKKEEPTDCTFKPYTLWFDMSSTDEWAPEPAWANLIVTPAFVREVKLLAAQCTADGLSTIRVDCFQRPELVLCDWDDGEAANPLNIHYWSLTVSPARFWFSATPKHAEYQVETHAFFIEDLLLALEPLAEDSRFIRLGDQVFTSRNGVPGFIDHMIEEVFSVDAEAAFAWAVEKGILSQTDDLSTKDERALCVRYWVEAGQEKNHGSR